MHTCETILKIKTMNKIITNFLCKFASANYIPIPIVYPHTMSLSMLGDYHSLSLSGILLIFSKYITICLSIHMLTDIWVVVSLGLTGSQAVQVFIWTFGLSVVWDNCMFRMTGSYGRYMFNYLRNWQMFPKVIEPFYILTIRRTYSSPSNQERQATLRIFTMEDSSSSTKISDPWPRLLQASVVCLYNSLTQPCLLHREILHAQVSFPQDVYLLFCKQESSSHLEKVCFTGLFRIEYISIKYFQ